MIPGYTHLQRAQPVYFAHHLLAYVEMFERDYERLLDCLVVNVPARQRSDCRQHPAVRPGICRARAGFVDARGTDGDPKLDGRRGGPGFCGGILQPRSLIAMHQSRLCGSRAWSSANWLRHYRRCLHHRIVPDAAEEKPDICELTRGKTSRVVGNLVSLLTTLKACHSPTTATCRRIRTPFDTVDTVRATVNILAAMLRDTEVNASTCAKAVKDPNLLATDLVDWLVLAGALRKAHHVVGNGGGGRGEKKRIDQLTPRELSAIDKKLTKDASRCLT